MIGLRCKDGVVLAVEKLVQSKLLVPGANRRIATVDLHAGIVRFGSHRAPSKFLPCPPLTSPLPLANQATAGLLADGRHLAGRARDECESYRDSYHIRVPTKVSTVAAFLLLISRSQFCRCRSEFDR